MKNIIEALRTTRNIETYPCKVTDKVTAYITKRDVYGNSFLIEYEANGRLLHAITATYEEAILL